MRVGIEETVLMILHPNGESYKRAVRKCEDKPILKLARFRSWFHVGRGFHPRRLTIIFSITLIADLSVEQFVYA